MFLRSRLFASDGLWGFNMAATWPERAPMRAQSRPNMGPRAPKSAPRAAQEGPKRRSVGLRRA
eukprot:4272590-Pyramimonas_sp.AAC.1